MTHSLATTPVPLRLWCEDCPVVCTGYRGAARVQEARATAPGLPWPQARKAAAHGLTLAEGYCARAFTDAQDSLTSHDWRIRRRTLVATYQRHLRSRGDRRAATDTTATTGTRP
jgi:hypothetical protein